MKKKERQAIQAIYDRDQCVTVSAVLQEAKKKRSPLHKHFQWDDTIAAQEFRKTQARHLIKEYVVVVEERPRKLVHIPFEPWTDDPLQVGKEGKYKLIPFTTQSERERILGQIVAQFAGVRRGLTDYQKEVGTKNAKIVAALQQTMKEMDALLDQLTH